MSRLGRRATVQYGTLVTTAIIWAAVARADDCILVDEATRALARLPNAMSVIAVPPQLGQTISVDGFIYAVLPSGDVSAFPFFANDILDALDDEHTAHRTCKKLATTISDGNAISRIVVRRNDQPGLTQVWWVADQSGQPRKIDDIAASGAISTRIFQFDKITEPPGALLARIKIKLFMFLFGIKK